MSDELKKVADKNKILEIRSGSHLYGTNTPESDEDFVGIFMPPEEYVYGLKSVVGEVDLGIVSKREDGKNDKDAVDRKLYEFRKFIKLAAGNNPNIIEILYVNDENIIYENEFGALLREVRGLFLSKLCVPKFIGYASSQKHKMIIRRDHFNELRDGYNLLYNVDDKLTLGQVYDRHCAQHTSAPGEDSIFHKKQTGVHLHVGDLCFEPGLYVKKVRKKLKERLDKATNRSELVLKHGYDTKFASHLIRLLQEGLDILCNEELVFPLPNAKEILAIKQGSMSVKEVLEYAEELEAQMDEAKEHSKLPDKPDYKAIENFTMNQMKQFLR